MVRYLFGKLHTLAIVGAVLACGVSAVAQDTGKNSPEPTYKGRTFSEWKRLLPHDLDWETRADAYRAMQAFSQLEAFAEPAGKVVQQHLPQEKYSSVTAVAYKILPGTAAEKTALRIAGIKADARAHRLAALTALAEQRVPTDEATAELAKAVIGMLDNESGTLRMHAVSALGRIVAAGEYDYTQSPPRKILPEGKHGEMAAKAAPLIGKMLNDEEEKVRTSALRACVNLPAELGVKELHSKLESLVKATEPAAPGPRRSYEINDDERMVRDIVRQLKYYGPHAKPVLPLLLKIHSDYPRLASITRTSLSQTVAAIQADSER